MKDADTRKTPHEVAAERVAVILADEQTPQFLRDVLEDAICTLSNETEMDLTNPEIARMTLGIGLRDAEAQGLRQHNGSTSREPEAAGV